MSTLSQIIKVTGAIIKDRTLSVNGLEIPQNGQKQIIGVDNETRLQIVEVFIKENPNWEFVNINKGSMALIEKSINNRTAYINIIGDVFDTNDNIIGKIA